MNEAARLARLGVKTFEASTITPERTGRLKYTGIHATNFGEDATKWWASIVFDINIVPYIYYLEYCTYVGKTTKLNKHKGFVEKLTEQVLTPLLVENIKNV